MIISFELYIKFYESKKEVGMKPAWAQCAMYQYHYRLLILQA